MTIIRPPTGTSTTARSGISEEGAKAGAEASTARVPGPAAPGPAAPGPAAPVPGSDSDRSAISEKGRETDRPISEVCPNLKPFDSGQSAGLPAGSFQVPRAR
jgi:hypothetical protein